MANPIHGFDTKNHQCMNREEKKRLVPPFIQSRLIIKLKIEISDVLWGVKHGNGILLSCAVSTSCTNADCTRKSQGISRVTDSKEKGS